VGALALTPAGSLAQSVITIFQPQQVAPLYVTSTDLQSLPNLQQYGTVHAPATAKPTTVADAAAASQATGMHVLVPGSLPASVPSQASYQVMQSTSGSFTFSAATALSCIAMSFLHCHVFSLSILRTMTPAHVHIDRRTRSSARSYA